MDHRANDTAHRIKVAADARKISIRQLAERTGIGYASLHGAIVTGTRELKVTHLFALADALDVGVDSLIASDAA